MLHVCPKFSTRINVQIYFCWCLCVCPTICFVLCLVSDLAPGQMGIDDMKMLEQKAQQLAAVAEQDKPKPKEKILFVRFVFFYSSEKYLWKVMPFYKIGLHVPKEMSYSLHLPMQEWHLSQWVGWAFQTSQSRWDRHWWWWRGWRWWRPGTRRWVTDKKGLASAVKWKHFVFFLNIHAYMFYSWACMY